ncbi:MAG: hypothetical protein AAFR28_00015 [Pseudomonadota bacterium]
MRQSTTTSLQTPKLSELPSVILLCKSLRTWSNARALGEPAQQALFSLLSHRGLGLFAPVFDGFFTCVSLALGRDLKVGCGCSISADEAVLWSLLRGASPSVGGLAPTGSSTSLIAAAAASVRLAMSWELLTSYENYSPANGDLPVDPKSMTAA